MKPLILTTMSIRLLLSHIQDQLPEFLLMLILLISLSKHQVVGNWLSHGLHRQMSEPESLPTKYTDQLLQHLALLHFHPSPTLVQQLAHHTLIPVLVNKPIIIVLKPVTLPTPALLSVILSTNILMVNTQPQQD